MGCRQGRRSVLRKRKVVKVRRWVAVFLVGAVGLPISILAEMRFGLLAGGFADTFGLLMIISLFAMLFGVWRHTGHVDGQESANE